MWDNPVTGVAFVLLMTLGGLLVGTALGLLTARSRLNRWVRHQDAYNSRPLDDARTFEQWCKDEKKGRWKS